MSITGIEFFEDLIELHSDPNNTPDKYIKMRNLLERACKDLTSNEQIQFSNLFSRLNYVCEKFNLTGYHKYWINTLRVNANKVLHKELLPEGDCSYKSDLMALCDFGAICFKMSIPEDLISATVGYAECRRQIPNRRRNETIEKIRIEVSTKDDQFVYGFDEDRPTEEPIKIRHGLRGINEEFNATIIRLWKGCQLNLIGVTIDEQGIYSPDLIILEPDYLLDISSLAECMKDYGKHPLNYVQGKFEAIKNTAPILLGNAANSFLDDFVNEQPHSPVVYATAMKKVFKSAPFEFSTCSDLATRDEEIAFFQNAQRQFHNIQNVVNNVFPGKQIDREKAILEPNFICEHLGVQGRLDFLQYEANNGGNQFVIELKSGKAGHPEDDPEITGLNHRSQLFIYQILLQKVLRIEFSKLTSFLLYSKYTDSSLNLRNPRPYMSAIKEIMNVRNLIVANERDIASDTTGQQSKNIVDSIQPETLVTDKPLTHPFIANYIIPQIKKFKSFFQDRTELELEYFHAFYSFVTKEHYVSKAGDAEYTSSKGISSLWLSSLEEKFETGEILVDLVIIENSTEKDIPTIKLTIPTDNNGFLHNFRQGDIVILYERNHPTDNVTNKQIFKGSIQELSPNEITIRIRYKQRKQSVLPQNSKYSIEHDFLDSSYNSMYRGLYSFLQANQDRRDILLNKRRPSHDLTQSLNGNYISEEINEVVLKAKQAKDYFLLIGPPGTGKTSIALKSMVEEFYSEGNKNILLLSYTNRAVDEICDALDLVQGNPPYIRIGSELSCATEHRRRLLENVIEHCENREEVKQKIQKHRIFVGTAASLSSKTELFKLKHFQIAIIDEASQILEPSLIGILTAKNATGGNAIDKFILIGDYKQLPAVVLQGEDDSKVSNPLLNEIGLTNRRNSLFERLYHLNKPDGQSLVWGMLHEQWRMHPDISLFPNYSFYKRQLIDGSADHQKEVELNFKGLNKENPFHKLIASKRIAFIPSERNMVDKTYKTNTYEAKIAQALLKNIFEVYKINDLKFSKDTVGIITPFRSQIALIKKEIHDLNIPELNDITVDTVERFQGSQRDIIIYSFSINQFKQLDFLANNIEEDGQTIDRKLNVAITRARKQLFVTGNPTILSNDLTYYRFIEFIRSKSGYIKANAEDFIAGRFVLEEVDTDIEVGNEIYSFDTKTEEIFDTLIIQPLKSDSRTPKNHKWYEKILGNDVDFNRMNLIGFGRSDFSKNQEQLFGYTLPERINLYCFYNMRKHLFTSLAIFKSFNDYFYQAIANSNKRITFLDFGCGPLTSGLAFNQHFSQIPNFYFTYIGIDISIAMLNKAQEFSKTDLFNRDTKFQFSENLSEMDNDFLESTFKFSNIIFLNFCYLFGNLNEAETKKLADQINELIDNYELSRFIAVYQNSALEPRNRSWQLFKKLVPRLKSVTAPKIKTIVYRNSVMSSFDKSETVYYEILST